MDVIDGHAFLLGYNSMVARFKQWKKCKRSKSIGMPPAVNFRTFATVEVLQKG
jgi:hypothetical protein